MWSTTTYCASCDTRVSNTATGCHKCGASFAPDHDDAGPCCRGQLDHEPDCFAR